MSTLRPLLSLSIIIKRDFFIEDKIDSPAKLENPKQEVPFEESPQKDIIDENFVVNDLKNIEIAKTESIIPTKEEPKEKKIIQAAVVIESTSNANGYLDTMYWKIDNSAPLDKSLLSDF